MRPRKSRPIYGRCRLLLLLSALLAILLVAAKSFISITPFPNVLHPTSASSILSDIIGPGINSSNSQPALPNHSTQAASQQKPQEIINAILSSLSDKSLSATTVIDVGANKGYPATRLALSFGVGTVVSVEPDERNFGTLSKLSVKAGTRFIPVKGACGEREGKVEMAFHAERDDFTCVGCLNKSSEDVETREVDMVTVDGVMKGNASGESDEVILLKTDTQGFEGEVLGGASETLKRTRFVLLEFDPKLLRTRERVERVFKELRGFACVHLKFAPERKAGDADLQGFNQWIKGGDNVKGGWGDFYEFMLGKSQGTYTDLLCVNLSLT